MAPCHKIDNVGCLAEMEVVVFLKALLHRWHVQNLQIWIIMTCLQSLGFCLQHVFNTPLYQHCLTNEGKVAQCQLSSTEDISQDLIFLNCSPNPFHNDCSLKRNQIKWCLLVHKCCKCCRLSMILGTRASQLVCIILWNYCFG